jgi:hypothetical protein
MSLLVMIVVVLLVLGLAMYAVQLLPFPEPPLKQFIQVALVIIAILVILSRAGFMA